MRRLATVVFLLTLTGCGGKYPWEMGPFKKFATLGAKPTPTPTPTSTPIPAPSPTALSAVTVESLGAVFTRTGIEHTVETDSEGAPAFYFDLDGAKVGMFTYPSRDASLASVEFSAAFEVKTANLEKLIADWNQRKRYCRAALRKNGNPELRYDVDLVVCGLEGQLGTAIDLYRSMLREYRTHIGFD